MYKLYEVTSPQGEVCYLVREYDGDKTGWIESATIAPKLLGNWNRVRAIYPKDEFDLIGVFTTMEEIVSYITMIRLVE